MGVGVGVPEPELGWVSGWARCCSSDWRRCWWRLQRWMWVAGWGGWEVEGGRAGLSVQPQVFVLLAEPVQLHFKLFNAPPLSFQKLLLALDDVVELQ